jgi:hypothetical protein
VLTFLASTKGRAKKLHNIIGVTAKLCRIIHNQLNRKTDMLKSETVLRVCCDGQNAALTTRDAS